MLVTAGTILFIIVVVLVLSFHLVRRKYNTILARTFSQAAEPIKRRGGVVIAYHPQAREIGEAVLRSGGNAFDAFVATVAAENVLAEGATSLAGSLAVLTYHAADGAILYLDADFNDPIDPAGRADAGNKNLGRAVLVPGAPAGLEALATRYGSMPFAELLEPAAELAENGFHVNRLMEAVVRQVKTVLNRTSYGRETFFRDGKAPERGEMLYQPEVATFLRRLGKEGSSYVYSGDWAERFLSTVQSQGGVLTEKDLSQYHVSWSTPWTTTYRGHTIHSSSGNSYGGVWVLLALKTLEHADLPRTPYWEDADALELLVRIGHQSWSEPTIFNYGALNDPETIQGLLTPEHTRSILQRVRDRAPLNFMGGGGSHSYQVITTDDAGNIANGTTTINSGPWGDGLFVEGIPLTNAGRIPWNTEPGARRLAAFSIHLAMDHNRPRFTVGAIGNSLPETAFQLLVKLIDYDMPVTEAVATPRFGTFPDTSSSRKISVKLDRNWLDPRIDQAVVKTLKKRGLKFQQKGLVDTGLGAAIRFEGDEGATGVTAPVPYFNNAFGY